MSKNEKLTELFAEWKEANPLYKRQFISDGIINEETYESAKRKILFIAKESNDPSSLEDWDYRQWWNEEALRYTFSYRIAEWCYGILNDFPLYDTIWKDPLTNKKSIQSIAFMNIKKIGGGATAKKEEMLQHAISNKDFIKRQIEIIAPEIIILGVSWPELRDALFPELKWEASGYDLSFSRTEKYTVIDFYHPSVRMAPAATYSLLQNVIKYNNI